MSHHLLDLGNDDAASPHFYYLLLHGWMLLFGDSILAVQSLSMLFGVVTVALVIKLTRWLANERAALLAGGLMAMMPMAVRYSQEARMYALMGTLAGSHKWYCAICPPCSGVF
ncbi:glycosyltransferase family 39 protein [Serratia quinivorans]|nr:glycosyltransferase family 39 protein [Serratia quinivorans]